MLKLLAVALLALALVAVVFAISGIPSFRERPDFGAFRPSRRANGEP
jgi:hypothetical protein